MWTDGSHARIAPRALWSSKSLFCLPSVWGRVPTVGAAATPSPSVPRGAGSRHSQALPTALVLATPSWVFFSSLGTMSSDFLDLMSKMFTNHMCFETQMAHFHPENPTSWSQ